MPAEHVLTPADKCPCGKPQTGSGYCSYECYSKHEPASMGEPLSEAERIAEIRSRLDAATPGPWSTEYDSYGDEWWFGGTGAGQNTINFPNGSRAGVLGGDCRAEAELIANAPGDIAYLLERNALLEGQLATAQAQLALVDEHIAYERKIGRRIEETDDQLKQQRLLGHAEARKALAYALAGSPPVDEEGINCDY